MGKFYSLLTSVGIYEQNLSLLSYEMDLKLMENALIEGLRLSKDTIRTLGSSGIVKMRSFVRVLMEFSSMIEEEDGFILYFSGHGCNGDLCFSDGMINIQSIIDFVEKLKSKNKIIILDCCYSGKFYVSGAKQMKLEEAITTFAGNGTVVLASSSSNESSWLGPGKNHSLYTGMLTTAITVNRRIRKGKISIFDIHEEVLAIAKASSTSKGELSDISLFDHVKLTAAIASCMYDYLNENHLKYKEELLDKKDFYDKKAFLLCSMDISGIQKFIYTITSKNALRTLRARSFYLEIMMEHIIDLLLDKLELSRANLLYSGGGHCYLLLANTKKTVDRINEFQKELKEWLLEQFQIELYVAFGYVACTGNAFRNIPEGSYGQLFREMSKMLSEQKQHRYCAQDIIKLNHKKLRDYSRECRVCKRIGRVDDEGVCPLCRKIESLSKNVLYSEFFSVVLGNSEEKEGMPLPGGCYLVADTKESLSRRMEKDDHFVRAYSKNKMYTGKHIATKLWVGDYTTGDTFEEFAKKSKGINRIGVLRADVDNLGQAIVSGFQSKRNGDRYVTLSRTAALSRQLSIFFKYYIRFLLKNGEYSLEGNEGIKERQATIVYSGGDDVFIVGAWNDVIELSVDLQKMFRKYTQGTLSISAGIGIYEDCCNRSSRFTCCERCENKSSYDTR